MPKPRYYPALDGLRGVAALCVVLMHRHAWFGLKGWLTHGYLAVDFFFMLSGFVIASAYEQKLKDGMTVAAFLRARMVRLYPMLILGAAIGAAWKLVSPDGPAAGEIAGLFARTALVLPTLSTNSVGVGVFPLDPPIWSLFFELAINLAYVAALGALTTGRLWTLAAGSLVALAGLAAQQAGVDSGGTTTDFWGGFVRVSFPFLAGLLIYRLKEHPRLARLKSPFWVQALVLLAIFNVPALGRLGGPFDFACVAVAFPLLLIGGVQATSGPAATRVHRALGELSYPIYVLHYPIYVLAGGLGHALGLLTRETMFGFGLGCLVLILATSQAATVCYDRPVRAWLNRAQARRAARLAEAKSGALSD